MLGGCVLGVVSSYVPELLQEKLAPMGLICVEFNKKARVEIRREAPFTAILGHCGDRENKQVDIRFTVDSGY